jgi:hypothetical protein
MIWTFFRAAVVLLFLTLQTFAHAQFGFSLSANPCANVAVNASVVNASTLATTFSWTAIPAASVSVAQPSGSQVSITFTACGQTTLTCFAYNSSSVLVASASSVINVACPGITVTPSSQTICMNASATITASGAATYSWNTGSQSSSIAPTPTANAVYSVTGNGGCMVTATVNIFAISLVSSSSSVCPGTNATLTASGSNNYAWFKQPNPNTPFSSGSASMVVVTPTAFPSIYTVVSVFGTQCLDTKTISLQLYNYKPTAVYPSSVCPGITTTLTSTSASTYTWSAPGQTGNNQQFVYLQSGVTTYTLKADSVGCIGTATMSTGIFPTTLIVTASAGTICPGQTATLTAQGSSAYTWSPHPSLQSSLFSPIVVVSPTASVIYSVVAKNSNNCLSSRTVNITMGTYPSVSVAVSGTAVCPGYGSTLIASGAYSYTWTATTFTSPVYSASVIVSAGVYSLMGGNGGSCLSSPVSVSIGSLSPLLISITASAMKTCIQSSGQIDPVYLTASGGINYTWTPYVPGYMTFSLGALTGVTPTVTTCYTVTGATSDCSGFAYVCIASGYCAGVQEWTGTNGMTVFPNPVTEKLYISSDNGLQGSLQVLNVSGEILKNEIVPGITSGFVISVNDLPSGMYLVIYRDAENKRSSLRFVRE